MHTSMLLHTLLLILQMRIGRGFFPSDAVHPVFAYVCLLFFLFIDATAFITVSATASISFIAIIAISISSGWKLTINLIEDFLHYKMDFKSECNRNLLNGTALGLVLDEKASAIDDAIRSTLPFGNFILDVTFHAFRKRKSSSGNLIGHFYH